MAETRASRGGTRFCRTPQWLYGCGISLQAVATYGWLHGKYGYLKRINPSYATLAEELGVSRGSIINYLKELTKVGAVRVTVGGPKGRTINSYEIAFDAPFAFSSGQPADHSDADHESVVSPLTTSSQPADQKPGPSGQPVVPEEEVLKKSEESLSTRAPRSAATGERREAFAALDNDDAAKVVEAWIAARGRGRNPVFEKAVRESAALLLAAEWSIPDLVALAEDMARRQPTYSDLARHEPHWVRPCRSESGPRPSMATGDTSGRDHECSICDRPIKPDAVDGRCRDCREG